MTFMGCLAGAGLAGALVFAQQNSVIRSLVPASCRVRRRPPPTRIDEFPNPTEHCRTSPPGSR